MAAPLGGPLVIPLKYIEMLDKTKDPTIAEALKKQEPFVYKTKVMLEDIHFDQTVYHVSYVRMFDRARGEWLSSIGSSNRKMNEDNKFLAISQMQIAFNAPAMLEDEIAVETKVHSLSGTGFTFSQHLYGLGGKLFCRGEYKMVAVAPNETGDGFVPHRIKDCLPKVYEKVSSLLQ